MIKIYAVAALCFVIITVRAQIPLVSPSSYMQMGESSSVYTGPLNTTDAGTTSHISLSGLSSQKSTMNFNSNPANGIVRISYSLAVSTKVNLSVYNQIGQEVNCFIKEIQKEGNYLIDADISKLFPGIYFIRMNAGKDIITKKLLVN